METHNIKIGIVTIATETTYVEFAKKLLTSIEQYFCAGVNKKIVIITNKPEEFNKILTHEIMHIPPPLITLLRFDFFSKVESLFNDCNYVYYIDADCEIVQSIDIKDIIPDSNEQYVVVRHPWAKTDNNTWILENNPKSEAYIENVKDYFQGSFYGAEKNTFFKMAIVLNKQVQNDFRNRIITKWFDESYFNKYMSTQNYKILSDIEYAQPTKHGILPVTKMHHKNAHTC